MTATKDEKVTDSFAYMLLYRENTMTAATAIVSRQVCEAKGENSLISN